MEPNPLKGSTNSLDIFLPKGTADDDTINSVKSSAENTRPLGLKNTDNKSIAAAANHAITHAISTALSTYHEDFGAPSVKSGCERAGGST